MPTEIIQEQINYIFNNMLRLKNKANKKILQQYKKKIIIDIKCISDIKFSKNNIIYKNYIESTKKMINEQQNYLNKKKVWDILVTFYTNKLHNMLNSPDNRNDIISFIKEKTGYLKKNFNTKYSKLYYLCEIRDYYNFISEVRTKFDYSIITYENLDEDSMNPMNINYWITKWKDAKIQILKSIKPKSSKSTFDKNYPLFLLSQVSKMIPYWFYINPELKLYLIEITIPGKLNHIIEYKDENDNWFETYRGIEFGEPVLKKIFL
jgi:hypothetical protein